MDTTTTATNRQDVRRTLVGLIAPMVVSLLFIGSTNVVDAIFVARLGSDPLAAFSFAMPVTALLFQVLVAFGIGVTSVVARAVGAGDQRASQRLATHAGAVGMVVSIVLAFMLSLFGHSLFLRLGASPQQLSLVEEFMDVWLLGTPVYFLVIWGTAAMRGIGNAKASALAFMIQAAVNWITVPALTLGFGPVPAYGIRGAALGSIAGYALASIAVLRSLGRGPKLLAPRALRSDLMKSSKAVFSVALPVILTYLLAPATSGIATALLAENGSGAVAAYGVVSRMFDGFLSMVPLAVGAGLSPFVGQAWGGGRLEQLREAVDQSRRAVLVWGASCYLVACASAQLLATMFSSDPTLIPSIVSAFRLLPLGFASYGLLTITNAVYNGIGQSEKTARLALLRTLGLSIPLAFVGAHFFAGPGLFVALAASSIVAELVGAHWLRRDGLRGRSLAPVLTPASEA